MTRNLIRNRLTSNGHNLIGIGNGSSTFTNGVNGDLVGSTNAPLDAKLGPLADNGGPTLTLALLAGSPAIDAGSDGNCSPTDQRGEPRPAGLHCDIGAFELDNPPVAICRDVTVSLVSGCTTNVSIDDGSFDPDTGDTVTLSQSPPGPYPVGITTVTLTATDGIGATEFLYRNGDRCGRHSAKYHMPGEQNSVGYIAGWSGCHIC